MGRRQFGRLALTGAAAGAAFLSRAGAACAGVDSGSPGIKLSVQVPADPSDEDLQFVAQLGVEYVNIPSGGESATLENYLRLRRKVEAAGLKIWNIGNSNVHNMEEVTLNLPGRDQKIEEYKAYLRNLGKAGIHYTTYAHMGNGIWSTERESTRGGAPTRAFDLSKADQGRLGREDFQGAAHARPGLFAEGDLGQLRVLHQSSGSRRRAGGDPDRHPPGRPAGPGAGRRAALHLQQL